MISRKATREFVAPKCNRGEFGHHARLQAPSVTPTGYIPTRLQGNRNPVARVNPNCPPTKSRASPPAPPAPPAPSLLIPLSRNEIHGPFSLGVPHPLQIRAHRTRACLVRVMARPTRRTAAKLYLPVRWGVGSCHLPRLLCAVLIYSLPQLVRYSRTLCRSTKFLLS